MVESVDMSEHLSIGFWPDGGPVSVSALSQHSGNGCELGGCDESTMVKSLWLFVKSVI